MGETADRMSIDIEDSANLTGTISRANCNPGAPNHELLDIRNTQARSIRRLRRLNTFRVTSSPVIRTSRQLTRRGPRGRQEGGRRHRFTRKGPVLRIRQTNRNQIRHIRHVKRRRPFKGNLRRQKRHLSKRHTAKTNRLRRRRRRNSNFTSVTRQRNRHMRSIQRRRHNRPTSRRRPSQILALRTRMRRITRTSRHTLRRDGRARGRMSTRVFIIRTWARLPHVTKELNAQLLRRVRHNNQSNGPPNGRNLTGARSQARQRVVTRSWSADLLVIKGQCFRRNSRGSHASPGERGHMRQDRHKAVINGKVRHSTISHCKYHRRKDGNVKLHEKGRERIINTTANSENRSKERIIRFLHQANRDIDYIDRNQLSIHRTI